MELLGSAKIVQKFFEFQNNIKLFHFQTESYAAHKSSDDLYSKFQELYDEFLEVYQGEFDRIPQSNFSTTISSMNDIDIIQYVNDFVDYLDDLRSQLENYNGLTKIIDELEAICTRFNYLMSFK